MGFVCLQTNLIFDFSFQGYDNALKDYTVNLSFAFHSTYERLFENIRLRLVLKSIGLQKNVVSFFQTFVLLIRKHTKHGKQKPILFLDRIYGFLV